MAMGSALLVFALIVIGLATYLVKSGSNSESVLRLFGMIVIVMLAAFLVVAGYNNVQMAPAYGFLGTIAGYLLGKKQAKKQ